MPPYSHQGIFQKPMTNPLHKRLTDQLKARGKPDAANMAATILQKRGHMNSDGSLTYNGMIRASMSAGERAIDRAAKASGRHPSQYVYNSKTNRATLR